MNAEPRRLLIVEDDEDQRETAAAILRDAGFEVVEAADAAAALAECDRRDPHVLLVDLRLPGMDGASFIEAYRRRPHGAARIVVMSARDDGAETTARARADAFLSKPFELDDLVGAVRRVLARAVS